jgi:ATP-dependent RNA helicase RhlE
VKSLNRANISAEAIHGNKSQNARQKALTGFKAGSLRILVATDIAARGIDVDDLKYVINFELPNQPETYVHRIGRTGRAGSSGTAWSFCEFEEQPFLKDIEKLTVQSIPRIEDHPYHVPLKVFSGAAAGQAKKPQGKPASSKPSSKQRRRVKAY